MVVTSDDGTGNPRERWLCRWLQEHGETVELRTDDQWIDEIKSRATVRPDVLVSYNLRRRVPAWVLHSVPGVNLHIGYLPWNKGTHPVVWSVLDRTPMGVTIHWMDEDIDTGEIITQARVEYYEHDTLRHIYDQCHRRVQLLFTATWEGIANCIGTRHFARELDLVALPHGWDTTVTQLRGANRVHGETYAHNVAYGKE
jgi:methionyl-tRNA formyltransferase